MKLLPLTLLLALAVSAKAQTSQQDSIHTIKEVVITARLTQQEIVPSQSLKGVELQRLNSQSVADALRYFSGIQLKDYGGVGGIKTVDIRSMGTHHLGIFYDGIELGNAQTLDSSRSTTSRKYRFTMDRKVPFFSLLPTSAMPAVCISAHANPVFSMARTTT